MVIRNLTKISQIGKINSVDMIRFRIFQLLAVSFFAFCCGSSLLAQVKSDSIAKMTPKQMDSARSAAMKSFGATSTGSIALKREDVSIADELLFIRKNLGMYQKTHTTGVVLQFMGALIGVGGYVATFRVNPKAARTIGFVGGGLAFAGCAVYLGAGKYLRRIELGVAGAGVAAKYTF